VGEKEGGREGERDIEKKRGARGGGRASVCD